MAGLRAGPNLGPMAWPIQKWARAGRRAAGFLETLRNEKMPDVRFPTKQTCP